MEFIWIFNRIYRRTRSFILNGLFFSQFFRWVARKKYSGNKGGYGGYGDHDGGGYGYGKHKFGKLGKRKKASKFLYPLLLGFFITKMILFPLFVKAITIMSSSAYVFSKMSLLASIIFGLKLFLTNSHNHNDSKVEIVHVPLKKFGSGPDWDRDVTESKVNQFIDGMYEHELRPNRKRML